MPIGVTGGRTSMPVWAAAYSQYPANAAATARTATLFIDSPLIVIDIYSSERPSKPIKRIRYSGATARRQGTSANISLRASMTSATALLLLNLLWAQIAFPLALEVVAPVTLHFPDDTEHAVHRAAMHSH